MIMENPESVTSSSFTGVGSSHKSRVNRLTSTPVIPTRQRDSGLWLLRDLFVYCDDRPRVNEIGASDTLPNRRRLGRWYAVAKRTGDIVASFALIGILLPALVLIAALVKLDSPGPALFRQRRIGKDGREFLLWKFRSMCVDAPKYAPSPSTDLDQRVTCFGRLLRRTSLDELPQLINILKGEMSLVGPRPEMPFIVDRYTALERTRLAVKPGLTGLWQVSPARAFPIHENLQYDLHYIQYQNLMLDAAILLRTIVAVVRGEGAV